MSTIEISELAAIEEQRRLLTRVVAWTASTVAILSVLAFAIAA